MITRDVRGLVERDWDAVRRLKDAYWAERIKRMGPSEGFRIADELRRQMIRINPEWPDEADRREDLAVHEYLSGAFRRADPPSSR